MLLTEKLLWAGAVGGLSIAIPFAGSLPTYAKTAALTTSFFSAAGLVALESIGAEWKRYQLAQQKINQSAIEAQYGAEDALLQVVAELQHPIAVKNWIAANVPYNAQEWAFQQAGVSALALQEIQFARQVMGMVEQPLAEIQSEVVRAQAQELNLDEWREANGGGEATPEELYANCQKRSMIWAGNPREGKTVAAHFALWLWAKADPKLVIFAFDKHFGMNNDLKFASNWVGVPLLEEVPKNVQTCVVKKSAKDLEKFLRKVQELLTYRIQNNINTPHVVVPIDEFTNLLESLDEKEVESIVKIFAEIATEAPKYGIYFWLILHSLTKEEIGIPRKVLRACHVVMGCEMTQDTVQVRNCPRSLPQEAVDYGQSVYRERGLPAGFVTSLPIPQGYLPPPNLPNGLADLKIDWAGSVQTLAGTSKPTGDIYQFLLQWQQENPDASDDRLLAKFKELTGRQLNAEGLQSLKDLLDRMRGAAA
ncbi:hypothetical protein IFO70_10260 [Phormidium tenue FACHB-886]|nr:hypothetical protein [Phormidium tenue FACHB-886]